jgi:plasmid stability protein
MVKTTLYLPDELKHELERVARRRGISEAELYRQALQAAVADEGVPVPETGFLDSGRKPGEPGMARRVDELLDETGFGEW